MIEPKKTNDDVIISRGRSELLHLAISLDRTALKAALEKIALVAELKSSLKKCSRSWERDGDLGCALDALKESSEQPGRSSEDSEDDDSPPKKKRPVDEDDDE